MAPAMLPYHYGICESNKLGFLCGLNVHRENLPDDVGWLSVKCDKGRAECYHFEYSIPL